MHRPRAFLLDVDNWLGSDAVEEMTGDQVKAYMYLLCRAWHQNPPATLPNDDARLAALARVSPEKWAVIKPLIIEQFKSNGNGRLINERLMKEAKYAKGRAAAGAAGWTEERRAEQARRAKIATKRRTKRTT